MFGWVLSRNNGGLEPGVEYCSRGHPGGSARVTGSMAALSCAAPPSGTWITEQKHHCCSLIETYTIFTFQSKMKSPKPFLQRAKLVINTQRGMGPWGCQHKSETHQGDARGESEESQAWRCRQTPSPASLPRDERQLEITQGFAPPGPVGGDRH